MSTLTLHPAELAPAEGAWSEAATGAAGLALCGATFGLLAMPHNLAAATLLLPAVCLWPLLLCSPTVLALEAFFDLEVSLPDLVSAITNALGDAGRISLGLTPFVAWFCVTGTHPGVVFWPTVTVVLATLLLRLGHRLARTPSVQAMSAGERKRLRPILVGWMGVLMLLASHRMVLGIVELHLRGTP